MATSAGTIEQLAHTSWDALATGGYAGSILWDNSAGAHDAIVSGQIDTGGSAPTAGDTVEIYCVKIVPDFAASGEFVQGSRNGGYAGADEALTEGDANEIQLENLPGPAVVLYLENDINTPYEFAFAITEATGSCLPIKYGFILHSSVTTNALGSDHDLEVTPITIA